MVFDWLLHRKQAAATSDSNAKDVFANTVLGRPKMTASEQERINDLGTDNLILDPAQIREMLFEVAHYTTSEKKRVLVGEPPNVHLETVDVQVPHIRHWAMLARGYLDPSLGAVWLDAYEAQTSKIRVRLAFMDLRKILPISEIEIAEHYLRLAMNCALLRCEDTIDGRKALLEKVKREDIGVHIMQSYQQSIKGK